MNIKNEIAFGKSIFSFGVAHSSFYEFLFLRLLYNSSV